MSISVPDRETDAMVEPAFAVPPRFSEVPSTPLVRVLWTTSLLPSR